MKITSDKLEPKELDMPRLLAAIYSVRCHVEHHVDRAVEPDDLTVEYMEMIRCEFGRLSDAFDKLEAQREKTVVK